MSTGKVPGTHQSSRTSIFAYACTGDLATSRGCLVPIVSYEISVVLERGYEDPSAAYDRHLMLRSRGAAVVDDQDPSTQ